MFTQPFRLIRGDGFGRNRDALLRARELLAEAGWKVRDGLLRNARGEPFPLSILARSAGEVRLVTHYVDQLRFLGFQPKIRLVETTQYVNLLNAFDFDLSLHAYGTAQPPTAEVISYFHSGSIDRPLTANRPGIDLPVVDDLVMRVLNARSLPELTAAQRALDRVLLWNFYMIPLIGLEGPSRHLLGQVRAPAVRRGVPDEFPGRVVVRRGEGGAAAGARGGVTPRPPGRSTPLRQRDSSRTEAPVNGSNTSTPSVRKSARFLVATVRPRTLAVAAIMASTSNVSDRRCLMRPHSRKLSASIGKTS